MYQVSTSGPSAALMTEYSYNTRDRDIPVYTVAFRRATSVIVGVVWAGVVARVWWPSEARRELANGLSEFSRTFSRGREQILNLTLYLLQILSEHGLALYTPRRCKFWCSHIRCSDRDPWCIF